MINTKAPFQLVMEVHEFPETTVAIGRHPRTNEIWSVGFSHAANTANPAGWGLVRNFWYAFYPRVIEEVEWKQEQEARQQARSEGRKSLMDHLSELSFSLTFPRFRLKKQEPVEE